MKTFFNYKSNKGDTREMWTLFYGDLGYKPGDFPVTEGLCEKVISLPMHTEMEQDQLDHIISTTQKFFKK